MFIYLVASVAALLIIFGLLHITCLNDGWLQSSIRYSRTLCNELICRPPIQATLNNENIDNSSTPERPATLITERAEYGDFPVQKTSSFSNKDVSSGVRLVDTKGSKSRNLDPSQCSLGDILSEEKPVALPTTRTFQSGTAQRDTIETEQETRENLFGSLKSSIEWSDYPSSRLSTRQKYNLFLKETLKQNEARQKLMDIEKQNFNESLQIETKGELPPSSENKPAPEDISK
ncbi:uncharacterized protein LOC143423538 [Xylocopa sonorina]|uniref:uncharacterized protein LOC143423538 n=1 Tax=Xylocopa sonorina TaxID=1818115 RepID=UPI00403A7D42